MGTTRSLSLYDPQEFLLVRFITQSDFVSDDIRFITHTPKAGPSHAEMGTKQGTWIGAHAKGGVQERAANYCTPTWERQYKIPVTPAQYEAAMEFLRSQIGKPYDFRDICGIFFDRDWHTAGAWICSELVLVAMQHASLDVLNVQSEFCYRIDPERLHLSPLFIGRGVSQEASATVAQVVVDVDH